MVQIRSPKVTISLLSEDCHGLTKICKYAAVIHLEDDYFTMTREKVPEYQMICYKCDIYKYKSLHGASLQVETWAKFRF